MAVAEREAFPRFHVGESLLPANLPVLERLGVLDEVKARGFFVKYGAYFHDQEMDLGYQFFFREGKPWPPYTYEVQRGEFDKILLDHAARQPNVTLLQPASVERVAFDDEGVTVTLAEAAGPREIRARFLVDASGRDALIASRHGRRRPIEGLGKVALFAHFRGGRRWPGKEAGNIRIFIFEAGWFWYIPFANGTSSVGCVLHARTVRGREGDLEQLYESLIGRCRGLAEAPRRRAPHHAGAHARRTSRTGPTPRSATGSSAWATRSPSWTHLLLRRLHRHPVGGARPRRRSSRRSGRTASRPAASAATSGASATA